jgi:HSP20 family molecular chaperone IbpA
VEVVRRFIMKSADEPKGIRVYRSRHLRQWRLSFRPDDVNLLFEELIHRRWGRAKWQPKIDVLRTTTGYVIEIDLPGVDEGSVEVALRGRYLTVEGRRDTSRSGGQATVLVCERPEGRFSRVIQFGEIVEDFKVTESMERGVLTLVLTRTQGS